MTRCAKRPPVAAVFAHAAAAFAAVVVTGAAHAQVQRNFPASALRGDFAVVAAPEIRLNGQPARLAPGSRIRDFQNMLVLSGELAGQRHTVHYTLDNTGQVQDVWLLRPDEKQREPWPRTPAEQQRWLFDEQGQRWSKR